MPRTFKHFSRFLLAAVCVCGFASLSAADDSSGWSFAVTPYVWLPSLDGSLRYSGSGIGPPVPEVGVDDKSILDYLDGMFMIAGEVKKNRWLAVTDLVYVDFEATASNVRAANFSPGAPGYDPIDVSLNTDTEASLTGIAWTLLGGYRALEGPVQLDVLGGLRYFDLTTSADWQLSAAVTGPGGASTLPSSGTASDSTDVWDGLFGLRGRIGIGASRWFLPFNADIGAGESRLTWQAAGGAGYAFKWLECSLIYRTIYYDERHEGLMNALSFTGPAATFTFRF